jgi:hypothetical protein
MVWVRIMRAKTIPEGLKSTRTVLTGKLNGPLITSHYE